MDEDTKAETLLELNLSCLEFLESTDDEVAERVETVSKYVTREELLKVIQESISSLKSRVSMLRTFSQAIMLHTSEQEKIDGTENSTEQS